MSVRRRHPPVSYTHLFEGDDGNEATDPVTPQLQAIDALNPLDRTFAEARQSGVTTVSYTHLRRFPGSLRHDRTHLPAPDEGAEKGAGMTAPSDSGKSGQAVSCPHQSGGAGILWFVAYKALRYAKAPVWNSKSPPGRRNFAKGVF